MISRPLRPLALSLLMAFVPITVLAQAATGCATVSAKEGKKAQSKNKDDKFKNYSLYRNKDINWRILRQGQKEMGGAAFDSY